MNLDGTDARHLVGASEREETSLRPLNDGASTQRWTRTPARGSRQHLGCAPSAHAHRPTELLGCSTAREWERRERMRLGFARGPSSVVLFGRKLRAVVGLRWMAHDHRTEFRPRWEETFSAQAQVAAWSAGHAERERAGGPVSISGRMAAWHTERGLRESGSRAVFGFRPLRGLACGVSSARAARGPFSIFGPNFILNNNLSQFIFCSEIV
jgi:hypothetical protein